MSLVSAEKSNNQTEEETKIKFDENETKPQNKNTNEKQFCGGVRKDLLNIIFLNYMYFLQGLPLGLAFSVSTILASSKSSFSDQGTFTFALYPL